MTASLCIEYLDDYLLILNKPHHLLTVPGKEAAALDCLSYMAEQAYPDALVVHRLDMATSGLVIMARGKAMQSQMSAMFRERQIYKLYTAVCHGIIDFNNLAQSVKHQKHVQITPDNRLAVTYPMIADWPNRPLQKIDHEIGKPSQTIIQVISIDTSQQQSRLELEPITGRSHQLRLHLKTLGHSIVGDSLYPANGVAPSKQAPAKTDARLQLHAHFLNFIHPVTQEKVTIHCPANF